MADPVAVADQYISRGGRNPAYGKDSATDDLVRVVSFLVWAEDDGAFFGGERAADAYAAFCRFADVDGVALRKIMKGEA